MKSFERLHESLSHDKVSEKLPRLDEVIAMAMGKNSAPMNLTISKTTLEYLQFIADRGTNLGPDPTKICTFILGREIDRLIDAEPDPKRWRLNIR